MILLKKMVCLVEMVEPEKMVLLVKIVLVVKMSQLDKRVQELEMV